MSSHVLTNDKKKDLDFTKTFQGNFLKRNNLSKKQLYIHITYIKKIEFCGI